MSGWTTSSIRFSYIAVCQKFRKVPPRDRRRQARRGSSASARCTRRETTVVVVPFDFRSLRSFPSVSSLALSCFFRPSLHGHYPASSLLRRLLTSSPLSRRSSPQVRYRIFSLVPSGSTRCVSDDFWASLFPASSPPASGLTASSYSYGQRFATRFFRLHLAATLCVSLRLSSSTPSSSFHLDRFCPCWAHWGGRPRPRPTPWSAFFLLEKIGVSPNYPGMALYRRRLPHDDETDQPVFLTRRLHDSLPVTGNSGQAFAL